MFVAATLSLLTTLIPQGPASGGTSSGGSQGASASEPLLSEREQKSLADKLRTFISDETEYDLATGVKDREKTSKNRQKSKEKFEDEWEKAQKKGNLLGSMPDLRAIFYNCFERDRLKHSKGTLHSREIEKPKVEYGIIVPRRYSEKKPWPMVLLLPGNEPEARAKWVRPKQYFDSVWAKTELIDEAIMAVPELPEGLEFDPVPDYSRQGAEVEEDERNGIVLATYGTAINTYNVERNQVFLDCGRGNCGYGLRLVSLFPDRFAGVVLRDPVAVDDIRVGSLLGTAILMLKTDGNAATVEALHKRIEEKCPGSVTVIDAKGAYPHGDSAEDIRQWMSDKRRVMSPNHIVLEPNHDRFNNGYWIDIRVADSLLTTAADQRPRIEAKADRSANRITIDTVGIERFELVLNDDLVDLDKEFSVIVNGKAVTEQRSRSFRLLKEGVMTRNDWDFLFPVRYVTSVPKE